ncbi:DUF305 domain-containing protein [Streptomycetaceae bacterium NBC_01309]
MTRLRFPGPTRRGLAFALGTVAAVVVLAVVVILLAGNTADNSGRGAGGSVEAGRSSADAAADAADDAPGPPVAPVFAPAPAAVGPPPADDSVDVGFGRDMRVHHAQAVEMSMAVRDLTGDEAVRRLAYDIALTQQEQIGRMSGWLQLWGVPFGTTRPPMQWMSAGSMPGHGMTPAGTAPAPAPASPADMPVMPGMATRAQLDQLASLRGKDAEVLFLKLMIAHHEGGVAMAEDARANAQVQQVRDLARTMAAGQSSEIALMRTMLAERGA